MDNLAMLTEIAAKKRDILKLSAPVFIKKLGKRVIMYYRDSDDVRSSSEMNNVFLRRTELQGDQSTMTRAQLLKSGYIPVENYEVAATYKQIIENKSDKFFLNSIAAIHKLSALLGKDKMERGEYSGEKLEQLKKEIEEKLYV